MARSDYINMRINPELKEDVGQILNKIGLDYSSAINVFFEHIRLYNGLPFELKIPNEVTQKALEDGSKDIGMTHYKTAEDMYKDLGI